MTDVPGYNTETGKPSFGDRIRSLASDAGRRFHAEGGFTAMGVGMNGGKPGPLHAPLASLHPDAPAAYEFARWAFRGTQTAHTYSLARQQNVYGGVQRTVIPTKDISVQHLRPSSQDRERTQARERINVEELYPPAAGYDAQPVPNYSSGSAAPLDRMNRTPQAVPVMATEDPLFSANTGQGMPNPYGFNPHQRATSGIPLPGR